MVQFSPLETFKTLLDTLLGNMLQWILLEQGTGLNSIQSCPPTSAMLPIQEISLSKPAAS